MIPRIIHQLWIGESDPPIYLMDSCKNKHKENFEYIRWSESEIKKRGLKLDLIDKINSIEEINGKADIIRWEILYEYGGVFLDADSYCLESFDYLIENYNGFIGYENETVRGAGWSSEYLDIFSDTKPLLGTSVMAFPQNHNIPKMAIEYIKNNEVSIKKTKKPAWQTVGPGLLTKIYWSKKYNDISILSSHFFYPKHWTGLEYEGRGKIYTIQEWCSTRKEWGSNYSNIKCFKLPEKYSKPLTSISILISSYNTEEKHLRDCLLSIYNQTCNFNIEIVWINDGSDTHHSNILKKQLNALLNNSRYIEISYYENETNLGLGYSLNYGVKMCKNELIFRMDSDDIMIPDRLQLQYDYMNNNEDIIICGGQAYLFADQDGICNLNNNAITNHKELITYNDYIKKPLDWLLNHMTVCFRKSNILEVGNYNPEIKTMYEDFELWLRILEKFKKIHNMNEPLVYYRIHKNQLTYSNDKNRSRHDYCFKQKVKLIKNLILNSHERKEKSFLQLEKNDKKYLLLIFSCQKYINRIDKMKGIKYFDFINSTNKFDYFIIIGNPDIDDDFKIDNNFLYVKVEDSYKQFPKKVLKTLYIIKQNFNYEYIIKSDDDCLLNLNIVQSILNTYSDKDYIGCISNSKYDYTPYWNNLNNLADYRGPYMNGAIGYILSKKALNIISEISQDQEYNYLLDEELYEDKLIGDILRLSKHNFNTLNWNISLTIIASCSEEMIEDFIKYTEKYNQFISFYDIYKYDIRLNTKIDLPVYCINLESSVKRRNIMIEQFKKYNINYKLVNAIDGNNITNFRKGCVQNISYKNTGIFTKSYIEGTQGSENRLMACYFSHIKAIKEAYDDNTEIALIMEDDISFKFIDKWRYKISDIINNAPKNWTVLKLHTSNLKGINILNNTCSEWVLWDTNFMSACFYVINRKGMKRIVEYYIQDNIYQLNSINNLCADFLIYMIDNEDSTYVYNGYLVINNNNFEIIDSTINKASWRKELECQGIYATEKYFRENYIYINKISIPKFLEVQFLNFYYLQTVFLNLDEKIEVDLKKYYQLEYNQTILVHIDIEKKTDYSIILYIIFKKKIKNIDKITIKLFE